MEGDVHLIDAIDEKGNFIPHETMLGELTLKFGEDKVGAAVVDSVGAIQPIAEAEGDFGEAFMGKRAKLVAQVSRSLTNLVRNKTRPSIAIVVNHVHGIMGGKGHTTAGGDTLKYLSAIRMMIWPGQTYTVSEEDTKPLGFYVSGKIEKLRYGGRGREFSYYIVPQYGVHEGATALMDCLNLGLAESKSVVKMGDKSFGYLKKDLLTYAYEGKQRKFEPFVEALAEYEKTVISKMDFTVEDVLDRELEIETEKIKRAKTKK
jgi:hypothetical protein